MEENQNPKTPAEQDPLLQKLTAIEALLTAQEANQKKQLKHRKITSFLLLALVVAVAAGLFALAGILQNATQELPQLLNDTDQLVQQLNGVDFETLNRSLQSLDDGISKINFEELNASIEHLSRVTESLANITRFFGG